MLIPQRNDDSFLKSQSTDSLLLNDSSARDSFLERLHYNFRC